MVPATERYEELIADFATERAPLGKAEMMRIGREVGTDRTGLRGDKFEMGFVAVAARFTDDECVLVDRFRGWRHRLRIGGVSAVGRSIGLITNRPAVRAKCRFNGLRIGKRQRVLDRQAVLRLSGGEFRRMKLCDLAQQLVP